ncbi:hypothetical protein ACSVIJ_04780 [Pseudomonas sp. NCHU5208]|uniref:hypothetical protein n=1 Tax=unclassified Pseudomonas TaxID=196821 RepID=UPI003F99ED0C
MSNEDQTNPSEVKKTGPLRDFMQKLEQGARGLSGVKASRTPDSDPPLSEAQNQEEADPSTHHSDRQSAHTDDEPLLVEAQEEPTTAKSQNKPALTRKHGLILLGVVVVIALIFKPSPKGPEQAPPVQESPVAEQPESGLPIPADEDFAMPSGDPGASFGNGGVNINPIGASLEDLGLAGPLNVPKSENAQLPAPPAEESPFGFPVEPAGAQSLTESATPNTIGATGSPFGDLPVEPGMPAPQTSPSKAPPEAQLGQTDGTAAPGKGDTILAGEPKQNPDSGQQPILQAETSVEMSELKAKLALQERKIEDLTKALDAKSKAPSQPSKSPAQAPAKPRSYATTQAKPKVGPRPKICVKAVAPPARNCSTCVAHAFVVDTNREDTMVGQGDYIAGYRVAITGDRIDLQNTAGEVVHKFWSQPNGCPSI